jgi:hypothetical protein
MRDEAINMDIEKSPTALSGLDIASHSDATSIEESNASIGGHVLSNEYHLATLSYKQEFSRSLEFFESWATTFTNTNFVPSIPVLFGFVMYTGGPKSAFASWTMIGGLSFCVNLVPAEIAAALPTAGGIYY